MTIGVFINPGHTPEQKEATDSEWGDRTNNRRVEYNALDDKYSKLIVDELLPELKKQYNLSDKPEDRAIAGASSGAICAFTVAWQRPDQFRKVISTIGSFTNIMGGHAYPDLIRKSDPKPIRVFLQDGVNDNRGLRGKGPDATYDPKMDWHAQNIKMADALTEKKYDVNYTLGDRHPLQQAGRRDHAGDAPLALARLPAERRPERHDGPDTAHHAGGGEADDATGVGTNLVFVLSSLGDPLRSGGMKNAKQAMQSR